MDSEKKAQREQCLTRRRAISAQDRETFSAAICRHLQDILAVQRAEIILSYRATADEVDLSAFHAWAEGQGKQLAFPVSHPGGRMEVYIPQGPESWRQGRYGIWEPIPDRSRLIPPQALDVVILPCVGFDGQGRRLGHGGGYYDRYLPLCPQAVRILVAFEAQRLERVSTGEWDQKVDVIVTESGACQAPAGLDRAGLGKIY